MYCYEEVYTHRFQETVRQAIQDAGVKYKWDVFIPPLGYTTDNAAMVGITGYFKYQDKEFCPVNAVPFARVEI